MANILVVDDSAANRKLLTVLLKHEGHVTLEAADGSDGLAAARAERPQLVISDILMPSMDGYEFVRRLRAEPNLGDIPVIFYTAHYHEREARALAASCGVARVLVKPCPAAEILVAVERSLSGAPEIVVSPVEEDFDHQHLRLLTNKLSEKTAALQVANTRLEALTELNVQMASERDPSALIDKVCRGARNLLGAKSAVLAVSESNEPAACRFSTSGIEFDAAGGEAPRLDAGLLGRVFAQQRAMRASSENGELLDTGLPVSYPDARSFLAAPVVSPARAHGWICLLDKIGAAAFDATDERMLSILGAQVGRIYENGILYAEVQLHAKQLSVEVEERKIAARKVQQLNRVYAVLSNINSLIVRVSDRGELLREACRLAVEEGKFRLVWCGWCEGEGTASGLKIVAAAGEMTELLRSGVIQIDLDGTPDTLLAAVWRTKQLQVCNDIAAEPGRVMSRADLLAHRFRAIAVLPFEVHGRFVGCLNLLADEVGFFDDAELRLLTELAGDISFALDHIEKSERLNYLAYYDSVTGLANRTLFLERLALQVAAAARDGYRLALVIEQLERLDAIYDALGRPAGEELIRQLAERLSQCVGDAAAVARIGPDRFAAILLHLNEEQEVAKAMGEWRRHWLGAPYRVQGQEITMTAKAGAAVFPADGRDAGTLLKNAEAAVNKARDTGDTHMFYTHGLSEGIAERIGLESSMRGALEREEFVLHYQPKVDLHSRRVTGVEALIRWRNPELGFLSPDRFIPIMEQNGMIVEVGAWALRRAIKDRALWIERGLNAPRVAVNVSSVQIQREGFVRTITDILRLAGGGPGIDIEITESVIMANVADNLKKLNAIRDLGVGIALDDFGTGYSSLGYLAKLPVETLKIDRSFIATMADDSSSMTLVSTIVSLAHNLKLTTVAEGVETETQARLLTLLRCDQIQGYLISKPLAFEDMATYLGGIGR
jgi:diguanylate cyclase (GGDEF)-like protein